MFAKRTAWNLSPNAFSRAWEEHRTRGRELLDLTESNPTRCGLHYDEAAILAALADPAALQYEPQPKGLPCARKAVAAYYRQRGEAIAVPEGDIILTTSTSEAYSFIFRLLCDPGDQVLVPTPSYPLFESLADIQDVRLAPYSLLYDHGWQIDFPSLEHALTPRTRAVLVVHPNNPTGSFVKPQEREQLNALCRTHGLAPVADEVFLDFALDGVARASFAPNQDVLTFTLSGISKISGLPQMKLAWLVVSGPEVARTEALSRLEIIADTYLSMNAPVQLAAPVLLEQRHGAQRQLAARIRENLGELDRQLAGQKLCSRLEVQGGWYAVLRVPVTASDEELAIALLQRQSVLVHPGHFYDFHSEGYLVLSLIVPAQVFAEGVRRVLRAF